MFYAVLATNLQKKREYVSFFEILILILPPHKLKLLIKQMKR